MSIRGRSFAGYFGLAEQTDADTPNNTPDVYLPITSESIRAGERPAIARGGIYSSADMQCQQAGLETNAGGFEIEGDGVALGLALKGLIGAVSSSAQAGTPASAPGATGGTSGTLADGDYEFKFANVFTRTADSAVHIGAASAANSAVTLNGGGNGSVALSWTNATPPTGYTLTGTVIYYAVDDGDFAKLTYQAGSGTSYDVENLTGATTEVPPEQNYVHTFTPSNDITDMDLPYFTILKGLDQSTYGLRIDGWKFGQLTMTAPEDGNAPVVFAFEGMGRQAIKLANTSPSYTKICSMLSHQSLLQLDGSTLAVAKAMTMTINNNLGSVFGFDGNSYARDFNEGVREITGQLTLGFENYDQWTRMKDGTKFALLQRVEGPPTTEGAAFRIDANTVATPLPYQFTAHMPKCLYDGGAGGNLSDGDLMNEQPNYRASFDATSGYAVRLTLTNRTSSYS